MTTLRDILIEEAARALFKAHHPSGDPDYIPKGHNAKYCHIDGQAVPNWKHEAKDAAVAVDAVFAYQKRRSAA